MLDVMSKSKSNLFDPIELPRYVLKGSIRLGWLPQRDFSPAVFQPPCAACQFSLPFRLLLRPGLVQVSIAGQPTIIIIKEQRQEAFDKRMLIDSVDGIDLKRDRAGVIRYSDVEIQFPYDLLRDRYTAALVGFDLREEPTPLTSEWLNSLHPEIEKVSIFTVNRLLRTYRFLSGEHHIRPITLGDIFFMQTGWLIPGLQSPFKMALGAPGQGITPEARPFSAPFHHELARWLTTEKEVPIWMELVQDAREHAEVGRFRHVVIDSRTALEVYLDQTLLTCFRQQGLSPSDVALQLRLSPSMAQSVMSLEEAIRLARINDKLKYGLKKVLGIELGRRKVWVDWLAVKELREGSVHYGQHVAAEMAQRCLQVVETLIISIHEAGSPVSKSLKPKSKT